MRDITKQLKQEKQIQKEIQDKIVALTEERKKYEQAILDAAKEYGSLDYKAKTLAQIEVALHNKEIDDIDAFNQLKAGELVNMIRPLTAKNATELSRIRDLFLGDDPR